MGTVISLPQPLVSYDIVQNSIEKILDDSSIDDIVKISRLRETIKKYRNDNHELNNLFEFQSTCNLPPMPIAFADFMQKNGKDAVFFNNSAQKIKCFTMNYNDVFYNFYLTLNISLPYTECYPKNPEKAGMSVLHILLVPDVPIVNAMTMDASFAPILELMKKIAIKWLLFPTNLESTLKVLSVKINSEVNLSDNLSANQKEDILKMFKIDYDNILNQSSNVRVNKFIHPISRASIGQFHLHLCIGRRTSHIHDHKNMNYYDLIKVLNKENKKNIIKSIFNFFISKI